VVVDGGFGVGSVVVLVNSSNKYLRISLVK
jgi:hypothetical protein